MKKSILGIGVFTLLVSCGGYTTEQGEAAEKMCECMEESEITDYDIKYFECDMMLKNTYKPEVFEEGTWPEALEEKCPDLN
ncbi:hypothetical protein [Crocinitomix algicola]|uniref:hypothetical protein n=1 Tax=Crocinitomix algicola TaxID=1740263 RepID=UPI000833769B|nr:hypothetical protein [Crocinitomix algicola]